MTRQKLLAVILILTALVSFQGCGHRGGDPLEYRNAPFAAEIDGEICPNVGVRVSFSAELELFERGEGEYRGFRLVFRSPDALAGLSVCRAADGSVTVACDGLEQALPSGDFVDGFIKIAETLDPAEDILRVSSVSGDSIGLDGVPYLTLIETSSHKIYLDINSSYPVRAEFSGGELRVSISGISPRT